MPLNVTRGELKPAKIINLSTNEEVRFMFNPFEYTITKNNSWKPHHVFGENLPFVTFEHGGPQTISLKLYFDTVASNADVRGYTAPLWKMVMIDESTENTSTGKSAPPPVAFDWGRLYFRAVITSISEHFTLFAADGTPLRSEVNISLQQIMDNDRFEYQLPEEEGGTTGSGEPGKTQRIIQGDRLDHIVNRVTGSSNYREIAEQNNIDNPLQLQNGQTIQV